MQRRARRPENRVQLDVDIRTMPGFSNDDVDALLWELCGEFGDAVTIERINDGTATKSPVGGPL